MHLLVVRSAWFLAIVGLALLLASDAGAVGGVIGPAGESLTVAEARYAVAISPAETTRWASIKLQSFPGAMAWLIPIRPGARVDEASDAWFEALELATAPRIVPTSSCATSAAAATEIVGLPNRVTTERSLESTVIDDVPALRAFASARGLELAPEIERRFEDLHERGFLLAAFLYAGSGVRRIHPNDSCHRRLISRRSAFHDARSEHPRSRDCISHRGCASTAR